ncbi:MAG: glutamine-hydrolyzing GMP synthase [Eubacteriales bacterium]|nr:glutamine-hydrolyzing GMP synthase [Eubacteriales bacterium]MDD4391078.1 glutamine-hydrolyzing GMP synthase [Eubacteriales bacterium]
MKNDMIIVLDFGGQYNQLIARRVRECGVYCEVYPYSLPIEDIKRKNPRGIILTGGPNSIYDEKSPKCDRELFSLNIPVLGLCYGAQAITHCLGGKVESAPASEYGKTEVELLKDSALFKDIAGEESLKAESGYVKNICWMSHTDYIVEAPEGFEVIAKTPICPVAAMQCEEKNIYAIQFHPEVMHTRDGEKMLRTFVLDICKCEGTWQMDAFVEEKITQIKETVGDGKVLCALSGGVDSSVCAVMLSKAVGKQLTCVFVDHGLLRKNEAEEVEGVFGANGPYDLNFIKIDAQQRFYDKLAGVTEPEQKRKIIGEEFIRVFEEEAKKIGAVDFLAQGTIYPDIIESGLEDSAVIKSHHNVGGLPDYVDFKEIIEPLRMLFKDEVRKAGLELGIPEHLVYRQPFPGPGLGIRIVGDVTAEKVKIVQEADAIYREEVALAGLDKSISQYFAALTNMRSVGVMGDFRTYDYAVVLRAITTTDFMTAEASQLPWELLSKVTTRIVNEVNGVSRVMYDCTGKPPATIEME